MHGIPTHLNLAMTYGDLARRNLDVIRDGRCIDPRPFADQAYLYARAAGREALAAEVVTR